MIYIRGKRERIGKTQQQIADEIGVTLDTISKYENGRNLPGADKLPALARALGCTIDALFRDDTGGKEAG